MNNSNSIDFSSPFWKAKYLLIDSRLLTAPSQTIFFALKGIKRDGQSFVEELYNKGVRKFVVTSDFDEGYKYKNAEFIYCLNTLDTLQKLTQYHRLQYPNLPVISITGSNAKTIVKEWLYSILEIDRNVVKSPKSYNSQIGVPLSVWQINEKHDLGIFEAGISKPNEMQHLASIIQPTIGLFTNIGSAHDKHFTSLEQKVKEKGSLFNHCDYVIYCKDHQLIDAEMQTKSCTCVTWGYDQTASISIKKIDNYAVNVIYKNTDYTLHIPFTDAASFENAMHCATMMVHLGYNFSEINNRIGKLKSIPMRLEKKEGIQQTTLINDFYNNDLGGLQIALSFLAQNQEHKTRTLILSDLLQGDTDKSALYQKVYELCNEHEITRFIGVGKQLQAHQELFKGLKTTFFKDTKALRKAIKNKSITFSKELILLKGARQFEFEKVAALLQKKIHSTQLEINLDAVTHNLMFYRSLLHSSTKTMVMVKALGYGSGKTELANTLQYNLVDYLGVAFADEGVELRENGIRTPIMVLTPSPDSFETMRMHQLEPEIYSIEMLNALEQYLEEEDTETAFKIQLNFDTGMHRLGFTEEELPYLFQALDRLKNKVKVTGVFTHLAGADEDIHDLYSKEQIKSFRKTTALLEKNIGYTVIKHCLNSAGIVRYPDAQMDMVRLGIGLHGIEVNGMKQEDLHTVATLKTVIAQIKVMNTGDTVGYSRKGVVNGERKIATIGIGYADGFDRRLSNGVGKVVINGYLAPIIGNVCMDMSMVDITDIPAEVGDEVIIFGRSRSISTIAKEINTIPYEILTSISQRVKRVYYMEG
ncbi:bifunctional UDP-N-acetylmuramoyl-tripeptide:D-alanyl-D-alanine ligase/alanine racemase [Flammeovirga pectinis]|uniref:Alanine racemase n=1 Tax=Flammeovirga pectinis TaxID=2494373 RepID=A0A3S9P3L5_9BACT|nr:bifunctional UDP-N-acetylmuramoyl-tripeptide:D-alanyl-D-alanine ligase/alanine racemase [Flammeovirga pectinis]AZQ62795.1 bifunctional UDP-N-acetylmuramoyl-tripeptide:D-alanyl-D-alanine ligase/alanine racemase [Flammeovirga pectinis]